MIDLNNVRPSIFDGVGSQAKRQERNDKYAAGTDECDLLLAMANGECSGEEIGKKHAEAAQWASEILSQLRQLMLDVGEYGVKTEGAQAAVVVNMNAIQRSYDKTKGKKRYVPDLVKLLAEGK